MGLEDPSDWQRLMMPLVPSSRPSSDFGTRAKHPASQARKASHLRSARISSFSFPRTVSRSASVGGSEKTASSVATAFVLVEALATAVAKIAVRHLAGCALRAVHPVRDAEGKVNSAPIEVHLHRRVAPR